MNARAEISGGISLGAAARRLFGPEVAVATLDPRFAHGPVWPIERAAIARAVPARQQEFAAGRIAARQAMTRLGQPATAIGQSSDRAPIWPPGLTGSISHCATACIAAVARRADVASLGVDVEPDTPLEDALLGFVCTAGERDWLARQTQGHPGHLAKLIFSAKESAYKCQYPLTRRVIGFERISVKIDLVSGSYDATFTQNTGRFRAGQVLSGRFVRAGGLIVTGMALRASKPQARETGRGSM